MKNFDMSGKVALVTGAGRPRGLGEGIAKRLAECGCSVLVTDLGRSPSEHMPDQHIGATDSMNAVCPNHVTTGLGATQNDYFSNHFGLTLEQYLDNMRARNPMRREGKVTDTANAVAFLCSEQAVYINGDSLNVTGGEEMH